MIHWPSFIGGVGATLLFGVALFLYMIWRAPHMPDDGRP